MLFEIGDLTSEAVYRDVSTCTAGLKGKTEQANKKRRSPAGPAHSRMADAFPPGLTKPPIRCYEKNELD